MFACHNCVFKLYKLSITNVKYCTKVKPIVTLNNEVSDQIEQAILTPKKHPGIIKPRTVIVPDHIVKAIEATVGDYPIKTLVTDAQQLVRHLKGRIPPMEKPEIKELAEKIRSNVLKKAVNVDNPIDKDEETFNQSVKDQVINTLKRKVYNWTPTNYDTYSCLLYLLGRFAPEYAVLVKIFTEINLRDQNFRPLSLFDFGSGVGTVMWAAKLYWEKTIFEYFNVDSSADMNDLSQILLQGGRGNKASELRGVYHRQFLPATNRSYDIVVSAYSLLEMPSFQTRIDTLIKLWNKTNKYLVIIEHGTNGGFRIINEARDFILQIQDGNSKGHVFSPCPHDSPCPRFLSDDGTPCNFQVKYSTLPLAQHSQIQRELYSYVILKKGQRDPDDNQWPRVIREALVRSKHTICRLCTSRGKLEEVIFTQSKHGRNTYRCARSSEWGDLLPIKIEEKKTEENK